MDPYNLDRKMSAMRLNEPRSISQASNSSSTMYGQYYHQQASGTPNPSVPYNPIHPSALKKPENVYANLEELSGEVSRLKARFPEPFIPPPQQFSTPSCEIVHRPSQSKLSLEEAMRYTPPNLMAPTSFRTEAPVYENIDFYSAPAPQTIKPAPSSAYQESNYHPVTSNFEQLKTNAYFAKQQPLQEVQPPQPISMTCKAYSPIHQQAASEIPAAQAPPLLSTHQKYSQATAAAPVYRQAPAHQPQVPITSSYGSKPSSPQQSHSAKPSSKYTAPASPTHSLSGGLSPKIPLAAIPSKKVI